MVIMIYPKISQHVFRHWNLTQAKIAVTGEKNYIKKDASGRIT